MAETMKNEIRERQIAMKASYKNILALTISLIATTQLEVHASSTLPGLYLANPTVLTNGYAQFELYTPSTNAFSVLASLNRLDDWGFMSCVSGTNHYEVQTPGPITDFDSIFFRAVPLGQSIEQFPFTFRISRNAPLANGSPSIGWPQQLDNWQATLSVENSTNFPPPTSVAFNGPEGSGFTNLMATYFWSEEEEYYAAYEADILSLPPTPTGGTWTVTYGSTNLVFNKPDPQTDKNYFMLVPHFEITNDYLVSMSWTYHDPITGAVLASMPDGVSFVDVSLYGPDYDLCGENDYEIYEFSINRSETNHVFDPPVVWSNAMFAFYYDDPLGNEYAINYSFGNLYQVWGANTFLGGSSCDPEADGYTLLGNATNTATFTGSYNWYMIRVPKHNVVMFDTVKGSDDLYYPTFITSNTSDYGNIGGPPDGQYATSGVTPRGFYTGGYFSIDATGKDLSSITVYISP